MEEMEGAGKEERAREEVGLADADWGAEETEGMG